VVLWLFTCIRLFPRWIPLNSGHHGLLLYLIFEPLICQSRWHLYGSVTTHKIWKIPWEITWHWWMRFAGFYSLTFLVFDLPFILTSLLLCRVFICIFVLLTSLVYDRWLMDVGTSSVSDVTSASGWAHYYLHIHRDFEADLYLLWHKGQILDNFKKFLSIKVIKIVLASMLYETLKWSQIAPFCISSKRKKNLSKIMACTLLSLSYAPVVYSHGEGINSYV